MLMSERLIIGCAALNSCIFVLSLLTLIAVSKRRCEIFSISSLLLSALIGALNCYTQTLSAPATLIGDPFYSLFHDQSISTTSLVIIMLFCCAGKVLYAGLHNIFALQYLCSSMTVPLHFEKRLREDSNFNDKVPEIKSEIKLR